MNLTSKNEYVYYCHLFLSVLLQRNALQYKKSLLVCKCLEILNNWALAVRSKVT